MNAEASGVINPVFGSASVIVAVARMQGLPGAPVVVFSPDGVSKARTGQPASLTRPIHPAIIPRGSPVNP